jgi:A/G-specific adenine glycosylase
MNKGCAAFLQNTVGQLPVKLKVIQKKKRCFDYFFFIVGNTFYLQQRQPGDIWAGLYQPYLLEPERLMTTTEKEVSDMLENHLSIDVPIVKIELNTQRYQQQLTHQLLTVRFTTIFLQSVPTILRQGKWIKLAQSAKYPFPKTIKDYLEKDASFV